jgi:hypothetical protein
MRIHTDVLRDADFRNVLEQQQRLGRIAQSVRFKVLDHHGSKSRARAYEVQLESWAAVSGDGRRRGNSGSYGAMGWESDWAATYDEWGWLLAGLYVIDQDAVCGSAKNPVYCDRDHFDQQTAYTYNPPVLIRYIRSKGDPFPYVRKGSRKVGRRGYGRIDAETAVRFPPGMLTWDSREALSYAAWAHYKLAPVSV